MMKLIWLALLLPACSTQIKALPNPILNTAAVSDERVTQVVGEFAARLPLNLNEIAVVVDPDSRAKYCNGLSDACTYHSKVQKTSVIHVPWNYNYIPQQLLAHELCHAYYFQKTGNPDANHEHRECFDEVVKRL